ncbi:MAG TPA: hypothetical protein VE486_03915 [Candidatus Baltobacteraceae bacterium]|nr:hypothetical protein [Candidatus Baltobacteraceae bacterium]
MTRKHDRPSGAGTEKDPCFVSVVYPVRTDDYRLDVSQGFDLSTL